MVAGIAGYADRMSRTQQGLTTGAVLVPLSIWGPLPARGASPGPGTQMSETEQLTEQGGSFLLSGHLFF